MVRLRRTVRVSISGDEWSAGGVNGFAGAPAMSGLGRLYEFDVECRGEPDPRTGYLIDIKEIDRVVRECVGTRVQEWCAGDGVASSEPAALMPGLVRALADDLPGLVRAGWKLTPTYGVEMNAREMNVVVVKQQFDFAAAHRLHVASLSDEENRRIFGRCNNPNGHGHNYRLEVAVRLPTGPGAPLLTLSDIERLTHETVITRFDHKHLNLDTVEFADLGGVNPSVENIARVCFMLLAPAIDGASRGGASLGCITVWETDRTCATYPA